MVVLDYIDSYIHTIFIIIIIITWINDYNNSDNDNVKDRQQSIRPILMRLQYIEG